QPRLAPILGFDAHAVRSEAFLDFEMRCDRPRIAPPEIPKRHRRHLSLEPCRIEAALELLPELRSNHVRVGLLDRLRRRARQLLRRADVELREERLLPARELARRDRLRVR